MRAKLEELYPEQIIAAIAVVTMIVLAGTYVATGTPGFLNATIITGGIALTAILATIGGRAIAEHRAEKAEA